MAGRVSIDIPEEDHIKLKTILVSKNKTITEWFKARMQELFDEEEG